MRFTLEDGGTRVELEHRSFGRHGPRGPEVAASVGSESGWPEVMAGYAEVAAGA